MWLKYAELDSTTSLIFFPFFWQADSESLSLKQDIFADLEKFCPLHCIFTSNSSTFSLKLIGERTKCQDRIARIHFLW